LEKRVREIDFGNYYFNPPAPFAKGENTIFWLIACLQIRLRLDIFGKYPKDYAVARVSGSLN
jgi:hypothetical protein